ncbi:PorZ beta-propeller-like domain-containing protein [Dyadobacter sediminis]|uniref:PorZ N-terminal beta-propeller domain-containing protein n=1 Tax=Dyadobacter sediminis TaxID=1493691 RepID=A0A5R9K936_9BACT|nr:two-component regulator propeller domain-containing protein [Dyadobacter sediminis]TLU90584.1 hypothetical protein FEM55_18690 [Dyadobacter sediminis]GGC08986.1 hypothetical protein GCM10011325_39900 [Dyadobacter sediminis]
MMKMGRFVVLAFLFMTVNGHIKAQHVPLGSWETHFSYLSAKQVVQANDHIFCSTYNGLFSVNLSDKKIRIWSKLDGLSESGVSSMAYDSEDSLLLVAYRSGFIDLVYIDQNAEPKEIIPWPVLQNAAGLPDNKEIKQVTFHQELAYLSTRFGILVLDTRLRQVEETYRYIGLNGSEVAVSNIAFSSDSIYAVTSNGILAASMQPDVNRQYFANWKPVGTPANAVAVCQYNNKLYAGFSGKGIYERAGGAWQNVYSSQSKRYSISKHEKSLIVALDDKIVTIDENNSATITNNTSIKSPAEALQTADGTLWIADYKNGLIRNSGPDFTSFVPEQKDTTISPRPDSVVIDRNGLSWARLPDYLGGGILVENKEKNKQRVLSVSIGNGSLPSSSIHSLALDQDGYVWFASDKGVGYFITDDILNAGRTDAILPVYGQRRLFANEKCTAIAVEPGNRKWIGTANGLFLFSADGMELIRQFTATDSPLPSDYIHALRFDAENGMVFIDTPNGMVSYRSNASASAENLSAVTIFPNPVRPGFAGLVGIKGLLDKSIVKITELSGRLIYETASQGGTASWNLNDYTGRRARGGIYMVFVVTNDGNEKFAGKLAVIE